MESAFRTLTTLDKKKTFPKQTQESSRTKHSKKKNIANYGEHLKDTQFRGIVP